MKENQMQSQSQIRKKVVIISQIKAKPLDTGSNRLLKSQASRTQEYEPVARNGANATSNLVQDKSIDIAQLVKLSDVCDMLALQKSAVYNLVATGELRPPLKFGTSRRAASRWLLTDVIYFVQTLADKR